MPADFCYIKGVAEALKKPPENYWDQQDERGEDNLEGKALIIG